MVTKKEERCPVQSIDLAQLWTVAVVLVGFEVAALAWRFNRELAMEADDQPTWLTFADLFVGLSVLVLVFGVFAAPLFGTLTTYWAVRLFGLSLVFFVSSAVVLAGHYNLYCELGVKYRPDGTRCGPVTRDYARTIGDWGRYHPARRVRGMVGIDLSGLGQSTSWSDYRYDMRRQI